MIHPPVSPRQKWQRFTGIFLLAIALRLAWYFSKKNAVVAEPFRADRYESLSEFSARAEAGRRHFEKKGQRQAMVVMFAVTGMLALLLSVLLEEGMLVHALRQGPEPAGIRIRCRSCRAVNDEEAEFCGQCGKQV